MMYVADDVWANVGAKLTYVFEFLVPDDIEQEETLPSGG